MRFVYGCIVLLPEFVVVDATTFMIETFILSYSAHEQCCKEREVRKKERELLQKGSRDQRVLPNMVVQLDINFTLFS